MSSNFFSLLRLLFSSGISRLSVFFLSIELCSNWQNREGSRAFSRLPLLMWRTLLSRRPHVDASGSMDLNNTFYGPLRSGPFPCPAAVFSTILFTFSHVFANSLVKARSSDLLSFFFPVCYFFLNRQSKDNRDLFFSSLLGYSLSFFQTNGTPMFIPLNYRLDFLVHLS